MTTRYKLLFHGTVRKDQHPAVVRGKLQKMLKANDAQMDTMFSGKPVTIKKNIDEATAEKYLEAFVAAGAKLELTELTPEEIKAEAMAARAAEIKAADAQAQAEGVDQPAAESAETGTATVQSTTAQATTAQAATAPSASNPVATGGALQLAEAGADLAPAGSKEPAPVADVPTEHLSLASPGSDLGEGKATDDAPPAPVDTSHLQLDQPGVQLGVPKPEPEFIESLTELNFELGDPGETLVEPTPVVEPELPDLSHLQLEQLPVDEAEDSPA